MSQRICNIFYWPKRMSARNSPTEFTSIRERMSARSSSFERKLERISFGYQIQACQPIHEAAIQCTQPSRRQSLLA